VGHSDNSIPENLPPSIGKGTDVNGVGSSEPIRPRARGGDAPLQTPLTSVPNYSSRLYVSPQRFVPGTKAHRLLPPPLGAESADPPSSVAPTPKAEVTPSVSEASPSPSLESSTHNAHTHPTGGCVLCVRGEKEKKSPPKFIVPCGGWIRELCGHGNIRYIPLKCHKWTCEYCAPGKFMEFLERLQGAHRVSIEKGWTLKFVTLTWAEDVTNKQVRLHLAHLVQAIRRKYGYCEYAKVPEWTESGRIHLHLAMIMPYIRQKELSGMWRTYAGGPIVWIEAVRGVGPLGTELSKQQINVRQLTNYLSKGPAGKVTYSRNFPAPVPLVTVQPGVGACLHFPHP